MTGSLFAAVGTALPETLVPLLAIFSSTGNAKINAEIGVGAILGAPLMLSTLTFFLMSLAVLKKRGKQGHFSPERTGLKRDLDFFLLAFALSLVAMVIPYTESWMRVSLAFIMVMIYFFYVLLTLALPANWSQMGTPLKPGRPCCLRDWGCRKTWGSSCCNWASGWPC